MQQSHAAEQVRFMDGVCSVGVVQGCPKASLASFECIGARKRETVQRTAQATKATALLLHKSSCNLATQPARILLTLQKVPDTASTPVSRVMGDAVGFFCAAREMYLAGEQVILVHRRCVCHSQWGVVHWACQRPPNLQATNHIHS